MKTKSAVNVSKVTPAFKGILFSIAFVTLLLIPQFADPFNAPKLYALLVLAAYLSQFLTWRHAKEIFKIKNLEISYILALLFLFSMFISLLASQSKYLALFGEVQRQTGFLAYMAFVVIFIVTAQNFVLKNFYGLAIFIVFMSALLSIYGLIQFSENDFFSWNNQYNPIILTLGNPNFASALMAILCMFNIGICFSQQLGIKLRTIAFFIALILVIEIVLSNSRQGLVALFFGISFYIWRIFSSRSRLASRVILLVFLFTSVLMILGMLQRGFLSTYLYKDSVSARGFYWRAGISMFLDKPFFGVGIDNFGANFKFYREENFVKSYGYELVSTNAHNVPIQLFATGGFFVGFFYLALVVYALYRGLRSLKYLQSEAKQFQTVFMASFLVYQAQSFVSIDNSGLTIWGWFLMGLIVATSNSQTHTLGKTIALKQVKIANQLRSLSLTLICIILISLLARAEINVFIARNNFVPNSQQNLQLAASASRSITKDLWAQPAYKVEAADYLIQMGFEDEGLSIFRSVVQQFPTNPAFLNPLAGMLAYKGFYEDAIQIRKRIEKYDPYNPENLFQIARLYISLNDNTQALSYKIKILNQFPNTVQAKQVEEEIKIESE